MTKYIIYSMAGIPGETPIPMSETAASLKEAKALCRDLKRANPLYSFTFKEVSDNE